MWIVKFCILILLTLCSSSKDNRCPTNDFQCENGRCILKSWVCDDRNDCGDNSDESGCSETAHCTEDQVMCSNGECISVLWRCDGEPDCPGGSDESNCNVTECSDSHARCDNGQCVLKSWLCDGMNDCLDTSDEKDCNKTCTAHEYRCESDGFCLDELLRCNGRAECNDGSDEKNCPRLCNEMNCQQKCINTSSGPRCDCSDGFELDNRDNRTCIDINECLNKNECNGKKCINTVGSYKCVCNNGYYYVNQECVRFDLDADLMFFNEGCRVYIIKRKNNKKRVDVFPDFQRPITGLSFQPKTQTLYIIDEEPSIYAVNLSSSHVQILVKNNLSAPKDVKCDWMSNSLYWVDTVKGSIEVISVDSLKRIVLIDNLSKPVSLAISPYRGIMFVSETGIESRILMFGMDGKDRKIFNSVQSLPMSLTLHPSETILYWSDPRLEMIFYINYANESSLPVMVKHVPGIMSVASSEDRLFYTSVEEASLQEDRKKSSVGTVHEVELFEYGEYKGWKSISYNHRMKPSGKSECLIENGGCSYICLTSPNGRTCACPTPMTLDKDGKSCLSVK